MNEIKAGRSTFDNSETEKTFGPIVIDYRLVQTKINNKYDYWHKQILNRYGVSLNENMRKIFSSITNSRNKLEKMNFTGTGTEVTQYIMEIQEIKKDYSEWNDSMESFRNGQKLLER